MFNLCYALVLILVILLFFRHVKSSQAEDILRRISNEAASDNAEMVRLFEILVSERHRKQYQARALNLILHFLRPNQVIRILQNSGLSRDIRLRVLNHILDSQEGFSPEDFATGYRYAKKENRALATAFLNKARETWPNYPE